MIKHFFFGCLYLLLFFTATCCTSAPNSHGLDSHQNLPGKYPHTSLRKLNPDELRGLDSPSLKIMRNEIFARHGFIFRTGQMKRYFKSQAWYQRIPKNAKASSFLSETELYNVQLIKALESGKQTPVASISQNPKYPPGRYPQTSLEKLTDKELADLLRQELTMMLNEIYARHGYEFEEPRVKKYFEGQDWYRNIPFRLQDAERIYQKHLSDTERYNIQCITRFQNTLESLWRSAPSNSDRTSESPREYAKPPQQGQDDTPMGLRTLLRTYPEFLSNGLNNTLIWKDRSKMRFDDGKPKDFNTLLNSPDLEDQFKMVYPAGLDGYDVPPVKNFDPGRVRYEPFFKKMYGSTKKEVEKHLVQIRWMPNVVNKKVWMTSINGVDKKLRAISEELEKRKELHPFVNNPAGGYYWRKISGTNRLSAHSFGIAFDINTDVANYWKWDKPMRYKNRIPLELVEIFEKHGFIWGGKWYHYDTMHFEYRPELLPPK